MQLFPHRMCSLVSLIFKYILGDGFLAEISKRNNAFQITDGSIQKTRMLSFKW